MKNLIILAAISLLATSCATIAGNNTRDVRVDSNPQGAAIYLDNQRCGVTPAVITLPSYIYGGKTVTVKKEGFHEQSMRVNTQFQPVALLDILCWPTFIIDAATGDLVKINPANLNLVADLQKAEEK